jgi:hypothetical protein
MTKSLFSALLLASASAFAVQPAVVNITKDPATTVKITRNKTNTGKTLSITANPQDQINVTNIAAPPPPVVQPPAPAPKPAGWLADEGGSFTISGGRYNVTYGTATANVTRELDAGTYICGNELFTDPAVGVVKWCVLGS